MLPVKQCHLPLNLRQSGNTDTQVKITTRMSKGPDAAPMAKSLNYARCIH